MNTSIIAFIDVLATKESVNVSNQAFEYLITEFNRELCTNAIRLNETDKISLFSDCAFIQFQGGLQNAISYLQIIREVLFSKQIYFKCAIAEGNLEGESFDPLSGVNREEHKEKLKKIVSYRYFGADSVNIYALHEKFKGIGFFVDGALARKSGYGDHFIESGFFSDPGLNTYIKFWDIGFQPRLMQTLCDTSDENTPSQIDGQFIDSILKSLLYSKAKKKEYARYYISTLITLVRSSVFSEIYYDQSTKSWNKYPTIFKRLYIDSFFVKYDKSVPGLYSVFFCMINEVLEGITTDNNSQHNEERSEDTIENTIDTISRMIAGRRGLIEHVRKVPRHLLHPRNSQLILERYAALGL